jgi:peroxiredoxin
MSALSAGMRAPEFTLAKLGGGQVSLADLLKKGPAVLIFFKVGCPTCQYSFPFLERLYRANRETNVSFLGISQDNAKDTQAFLKQLGATFPVALDDSKTYMVSNAYGLTNVPTIFMISLGGEIQISSVSWAKADVEAIHEKLAEYRQQPAMALWSRGEDVREFRAG